MKLHTSLHYVTFHYETLRYISLHFVTLRNRGGEEGEIRSTLDPSNIANTISSSEITYFSVVGRR